MTKHATKELFAEEAEKRVRLGLIVNAVVETESIEADADRVREKIEDIASSYEQPEQLINYYYSNEQALSQVQGIVLEEQVVASLLEKMTVETVEMSYEDAIQPPPPPRRRRRTMRLMLTTSHPVSQTTRMRLVKNELSVGCL